MEQSLLYHDAPAASAAAVDFETLARTCWPRVFRFVLASVRDPETAQNLTQDCFVRAFRAHSGFRGDSEAATWLMKIAINLVRDHESSSRLKFWRRAMRSSAEPAQHWVPDPGLTPEAAACARQQVEAVWCAAAKLPERQRTVLLLRFVEEMELAEIAALTGMKEGTVKTHLFRALQAVRLAVGVAR